MSQVSSRLTTPSPEGSITEDKNVIEQINAKSGVVEAKFTVEYDLDRDITILRTFSTSDLINNDLTYDTTYALWMALGTALDKHEDQMIPSAPATHMLLS